MTDKERVEKPKRAEVSVALPPENSAARKAMILRGEVKEKSNG